jgi:hypothetical protein
MAEMSEEQIMQEYEKELALAKAQGQYSSSPYSPTIFGGGQKPNIVEWELDFKPELEDIERLLRCDIIAKDKDGNEYWTENPDKSKVFLNELGVNDVLRKIRLLVNKNKVLSNYTIEEIEVRTRIIGHELRILIYNNYEQYGIDNEYKMHNYPMIVLSIMSLVEDAYRRALAGEAHKGLNEQRLLTQSEPLNQPQYPMMMPQSKKPHWYKPWTWGG